MNTYTTRNEAIAREITVPLGEYAYSHDIDAIADELIKTEGQGFYLDQDADFWATVVKHAY